MRNLPLQFRNSSKRIPHRRDRRPPQPRHRKLLLENLEDRLLLASNLPPVNSVPGPQTLLVNTPFAFTEYRDNAISTSDPDAGLNQVKVTLTAVNGEITLVDPDPNGGLAYSEGDGTEDATMTFTGRLVDINEALSWLAFIPETDYVGTEASLTITTNDQGYLGTGGPQEDTDTIAITVNPVPDFQDPPTWETFPGALDTSFNEDGMQTLSVSAGVDYIHDMRLLGNGKILAVGAVNNHYGVIRFNADLTLDDKFGNGGVTETNLGDGRHAKTLETDKQGRIVVGGIGFIARYSAAGDLDTTFGTDGSVRNDYVEHIYDIAIDANGRLLAMGRDRSGIRITRYLQNGTIDPSFGNREYGVNGGGGYGRGAVVRDDGDIILAGRRNSGFTVIRIDVGGNVEHETNVDLTGSEFVHSILELPDGKTLLVGYDRAEGQNVAITRHNFDGTLDSSFGVDGKLSIPIGNQNDHAYRATLQIDGKILISGHAGNGNDWDLAILRLSYDGVLDATFDGDGKLIIPFSVNTDFGQAVIALPNRKILIAGETGNDIALVRLLGDFNLFSDPFDDFGDAPSPYPVTLAEDGARHTDVGPRLGATRDEEADGVHSAAADDDGSDEDGVTFGTIMVGQLDATATVNVQNVPEGAKLDAWIDFNGDGSWGGPFDHIADTVAVANGDNTINFDVPSWAVDGTTYARFRLSTAGDLGVGGAADDGEVEDYAVAIQPPSVATGVFGESNIVSELHVKPEGIFAGDIDNDGDMDLVAASRNNLLIWYENDGGNATTFLSHTISTDPWQGGFILINDVDGDGDADIVSASETEQTVSWYENLDGVGGEFTKHILINTLAAVGQIHAADLDGDGDTDIFSASTHDDKIMWYENLNGDGSDFSSHLITDAIDGPRSISSADMDRDGDLDVLASAIYSDKVVWFENLDGKGGAFTTRVITNTAERAYRIYPADIDSDHDLDVVVASISDNTVAWYENINGKGDLFEKHVITNTSTNPYTAAPCDIDGDGDFDVLVTSVTDDKVAWHENIDGFGEQFTEHVVTDFLDYPVDAVLSDMNGNGILDVVIAGFYSNQIAWYENKPFSWSNPRNALDVNDDGFVTPIDAFIVITDLNENSARELPVPPVPPNAPPPYLDPSGDNSISPIDAFMIVTSLSDSGSGEGEQFAAFDNANTAIDHRDTVIDFSQLHQWNSERTYDVDTRPTYEAIQWRIDTDVPYTDQPIGFAERDNRDLQLTRTMASVSSWRELEREDLLDEIAKDIAQLDNDEFHAGFERTAATRRSK